MVRTYFTLAVLIGFGAPVVAAPDVSPDPKSLTVPPDELSKARALVQQLGNEAFVERELAERELATMGRFARVALLDGVNIDPDPEIRARCRALLPKATAQEMKARLDAFIADAEGKYEHDLPGWHKLRSVVRGEWAVFGWTYTARLGADKAARDLFIEFIQAPGGRQLLTALGGPAGELGQMVASRRQEMYNAKYPRVPNATPRNPSVGEVGVVLFAESQVKSQSVPRAIAISTVLTTSGIPGLVQGTDDRALALRAVLGAWFDSRTEPLDVYQAMTLANNMQNDAAATRLAARVMSSAGLPGFYKGQALTTLVRLKAADQIPAMEKAFADTAVLSTTIKVVNGMQVRQSIEVRDAALAAALVMTGQNPDDYGFEGFPKGAGGTTTFSYVWAKIPDEKRKEAFEKWKTWREKNP